MNFKFNDLDEPLRQLMVEQIELAAKENNVYYSKRFAQKNDPRWPDLLSQAARSHNEHWLAHQLEAMGLMKGLETSRKPSGGYTVKDVPFTAEQTLADGQFNRFYMIAVCLRAIAEGKPLVYVYRARGSAEHRSESDALIGNAIDPKVLVAQLCNVQSSLRHPLLGPNSGLSITLAAPSI